MTRTECLVYNLQFYFRTIYYETKLPVGIILKWLRVGPHHEACDSPAKQQNIITSATHLLNLRNTRFSM